jgi:hypothetical protein
MALVFMDSFDHYATADVLEKWTTQLDPGNTGFDNSGIAAVGRHGSNGYRLSTSASGSQNTKSLNVTLGPADNTLVAGFAFRSVSAFALNQANANPNISAGAGGASAILLVRKASADQCWIRLDPAGTLTVFRGGTILGATTVALTVNTFVYIEVKILVAPSGGTVDIRFNGASVLSLTAQNTANSGVNGWNEFRFGCVGSTGGSQPLEWDYDDLYILDGSGSAPWNTFLGDCRVDARLATAPGNAAAWTPSTGANWQCVDDIPPNDDTDYVSATASGVTDTFVTQDAPVSGAVIYGVQHCLNMRKTDAGLCSVAPVVRHAGTDYVGGNLNPGITYACWRGVQPTNPGTGAQWTEAGFNAAEFGYKRTV